MSAPLVRILVVLGALVALVGTATAILFVRADDTGARRVAVQAPATPDADSTAPRPTMPTAAPPATPTGGSAAPAPGVTGRRSLTVRVPSTVNVRGGPGTAFPIIGSLETGAEVQATGRNVDGSWVRVELPSGQGWVATGVVTVAGDPLLLPLIEPTPPATATVTPTTTTATPTAAGTGPSTRTPTLTARPPSTGTTSTPTGGLPDLVLQDVSIGAANRLTIIVANSGPAALTSRRISVAGLDDAGGVLFSEVTAPLTIPPSGAINVELNYRVTGPTTITVIINGDGSVEELSTTNNRRRVLLR